MLEHIVQAIGQKVFRHLCCTVAHYTLNDYGHKELVLLSFGEQIAYVISTEEAVNAEALVKKELNKLLAVMTANSLLKQLIPYFNLSVVIALKDVSECELRAVPI